MLFSIHLRSQSRKCWVWKILRGPWWWSTRYCFHSRRLQKDIRTRCLLRSKISSGPRRAQRWTWNCYRSHYPDLRRHLPFLSPKSRLQRTILAWIQGCDSYRAFQQFDWETSFRSNWSLCWKSARQWNGSNCLVVWENAWFPQILVCWRHDDAYRILSPEKRRHGRFRWSH